LRKQHVGSHATCRRKSNAPERSPKGLILGDNMFESDDLTAAMTELAKSELAFTNENTRDGKRIFIVDSVRLTEDELILLHEKRALTRDGIRHYLVDRAA
jgi:hypothetical protein